MAGSAGIITALAPTAPPDPDTLHPNLRLGIPSSTVPCFDNQFDLNGDVVDWSGIRSIVINGEDLLKTVEKKPIGSYHFTRPLPLQSRTNTFKVVATDMAGNATTNTFRVIKQDPEYLKEVARLCVAVLPPRSEDELGPSARYKVQHAIQQSITDKQSKRRFDVAEREEEAWKRISDEHHLSRTPIVNRKAFVSLGEALTVDFFLAGTLVRYADGLDVLVHVVDAETGKIAFCDDVFVPGVRLHPPGLIDSAAGDLIKERLPGLVSRIEHRFPLLRARIIDVSHRNWLQVLIWGNGARVQIDEGTASGVRDWTRFIVLKRAPDRGGIEASNVLRLDGEPVELRVKPLSEDRAQGTVVPGDAAQRVQRHDYVYTR